GSAGQASYAAANGTLAAIVRARRARGLAGLCVDWGPWAEGMAAEDRVRRRSLGLMPMEAGAALAAMQALLDSGAVQASVLPLRSWNAFFGAHPRIGDDPFFATLRPEQVSSETISSDGIVAQLRAMPDQARRRALLQHLRLALATVLGADPQAHVAPETPFQELGLDSLMSVELRNLLAKAFDVALPPTLALDYPTLATLSDHIMQQLFPATVPDRSDDIAAIVAMSDAEAEELLRRELEGLGV
ncbi:MAG TPA: beta-ketoacyl reductase, partial [Rhodopila sp.]|uniref:beta-ketoacyl reductase n=1 Tax=Rhodopila sp. TaxID=2480087 RepID=UPI002BFF7BA6